MDGVGAAASTNIVVPIFEYSYTVLSLIYTSAHGFLDACISATTTSNTFQAEIGA